MTESDICLDELYQASRPAGLACLPGSESVRFELPELLAPLFGAWEVGVAAVRRVGLAAEARAGPRPVRLCGRRASARAAVGPACTREVSSAASTRWM